MDSKPTFELVRPKTEEPVDQPITVKLTASQLDVIKEFCFTHDRTTSGTVREALDFMFDLYGIKDKIIKYKGAIHALLNNLP
jgi:hypothetical protein